MSQPQSGSYRRNPLPSFSEVSKAVEGGPGWLRVFSDLCPDLAEAAETPGDHVDCPFHGGKKDFRFWEHADQTGRAVCSCGYYNNPFELFAKANRLANAFEAMKEIRSYVGLDPSQSKSASAGARTATPKPRPERRDRGDSERNSQEKIAQRRWWLQKIWRESKALDSLRDSPVHRYFRNRGIPLGSAAPRALRFHPGLEYRDPQTHKVLGTFPCMVAKVQAPNGDAMALHRTYLTEDGSKADVPKVKMQTPAVIYGRMNGCAIRLFDIDGDTLAVTEGIENGWAVHLATGLPVWPTLNASLLKDVVLPSRVRKVEIWGDLDPNRVDRSTGELLTGAGQERAVQLYNRLAAEGREVALYLPGDKAPDTKGADWEDLYTNMGLLGFPPSVAGPTLRRIAKW